MSRNEKFISKLGFFISLISERNEKGKYANISIGRISFWIVFLLALWIWTTTTGDIQPAHLQMLYITTTYNLMKKASWFGSVKTGDNQISITHEAETDDPAPRI
jgi:hypothetical protein